MAIVMMEEAVENMRKQLLLFSRMQPKTSEEVTFYLAKSKLILEEYMTGMRMIEKEPHATLRCFETIQRHINDYIKRYVSPETVYEEDLGEDPWLELEDDVLDEDEDEEDPIPSMGDDDEEEGADEEDFLDDDEDWESDIIVLTDSDGISEEFHYLDSVYLTDKKGTETEYIALIPVHPKTEEEEDSIFFCEVVEDDEDSDEASYIGVSDHKLAEELFKLFKEENQDRFNFQI